MSAIPADARPTGPSHGARARQRQAARRHPCSHPCCRAVALHVCDAPHIRPSDRVLSSCGRLLCAEHGHHIDSHTHLCSNHFGGKT